MAREQDRNDDQKSDDTDAICELLGGLTIETDHRRPLEGIAQRSACVLHLCDVLEAMADALPTKVAPLWHQAANCCYDVVPKHYSEIAHQLVPVLIERVAGNADLEDALLRLRVDYVEDDARTGEFAGLLSETMSNEAPMMDANALGYSIRAYFDVTRRHMLWERDVLLPIAARHLTQADMAALA